MRGGGGGGVAIGMDGKGKRAMQGAGIGYRETTCLWLIETLEMERS